MSDQPQWYVMQEDQQLGPYSGEQLVQFASSGNIARESLIWAEGMENWLPAGEVEGVFPAQQAAPVAATAQPGGFNVNPYAAPGSNVVQAPQAGGDYPQFPVKGASFGLWLGFLLTSFGLILIPLILIGANAEKLTDGAAAILGLLALGGYALTIFVVILTYIYLYRAWVCLAPGRMARTTPGKAIGFMFIPFFNLYWLFQAFYGLSQDWNKTVNSYSGMESAPRFSEGLFLTHCIIALVFSPLAIFTVFPVMSQICKGINFFAFRPMKHTGGTGFTLR